MNGLKMKEALLLNKRDNVATLLAPVKKGDQVSIVHGGKVITSLTSLENIEIYHKIATVFIKDGSKVYKYGEIIGEAVGFIETGCHVHVDNLKSVVIKSEG